jgi:hypothetical protein
LAESEKVYQLLSYGRWFSPGTPASSTTKTGRHDIAEILMKVALKRINQTTKECISSHWLFIWQSQLFCLHYKIVSSTNGSKPVSETTLFNASLVASC